MVSTELRVFLHNPNVNIFFFCRKLTLEKEIFPAATDSRFIRAVSTGPVPVQRKRHTSSCHCFVHFFVFAACRLSLYPGGDPCHRLLTHEPDADPAARPQRVPERAGLPEGHRHLPEADSCSGQRSRRR